MVCENQDTIIAVLITSLLFNIFIFKHFIDRHNEIEINLKNMIYDIQDEIKEIMIKVNSYQQNTMLI